jgi:hypothetical protein
MIYLLKEMPKNEYYKRIKNPNKLNYGLIKLKSLKKIAKS